jgi:hypothetical protein
MVYIGVSCHSHTAPTPMTVCIYDASLLAVVQISDYRSYASRYVSLHSVDFGPPIPSFALLSDSHMQQHYGTGKSHTCDILSQL